MKTKAVTIKRWFSRAALPLAALALTQNACGIFHPTSDAISTFSAEQACPGDRLLIKEVEVRPQDLLVVATPPADVAADPRRLAIWRDNASPHFEPKSTASSGGRGSQAQVRGF